MSDGLNVLKTEATTVGGYFVSNYPPYSFWTPEQAPEALAAIERAPRPGVPMGVYVHIPFCRKRCKFCYFKVYTDKDATEIRRYLDSLARELTVYASKPFVGGRKPNFIYFGGGTPSMLSTTQLQSVVDAMRRVFAWDEAEEIAFECEPGTITEKKMEILRRIGVTRLSLGVENFSQDLLELNGRAHGEKEIGRAYGFARRMGFPQINIDLIAGMLGETDENWAQCVRRTIELAPDSVTIYQLEVPPNTVISKEMRVAGREVAPVADWATKRRWVAQAFAALEAAGYTVTSAYTAVREPERTRFLYRDLLWTGADMLALGVSSFGHINGVHYQNESDIERYMERIDRGELPIRRALTPSDEERMIRELILQMKLGLVRPGYFQDKFGVDVRRRFAGPFAKLREAGYLETGERDYRLTRAGLLRVDALLHEFFLPQHALARAS